MTVNIAKIIIRKAICFLFFCQSICDHLGVVTTNLLAIQCFRNETEKNKGHVPLKFLERCLSMPFFGITAGSKISHHICATLQTTYNHVLSTTKLDNLEQIYKLIDQNENFSCTLLSCEYTINKWIREQCYICMYSQTFVQHTCSYRVTSIGSLCSRHVNWLAQ